MRTPPEPEIFPSQMRPGPSTDVMRSTACTAEGVVVVGWVVVVEFRLNMRFLFSPKLGDFEFVAKNQVKSLEACNLINKARINSAPYCNTCHLSLAT
jgi:hypothetical protein